MANTSFVCVRPLLSPREAQADALTHTQNGRGEDNEACVTLLYWPVYEYKLLHEICKKNNSAMSAFQAFIIIIKKIKWLILRLLERPI